MKTRRILQPPFSDSMNHRVLTYMIHEKLTSKTLTRAYIAECSNFWNKDETAKASSHTLLSSRGLQLLWNSDQDELSKV